MTKSWIGISQRKSGCQESAVDRGWGRSFRHLDGIWGQLYNWELSCTLAFGGNELMVTRLIGTKSFANTHWSSILKLWKLDCRLWEKSRFFAENSYILGGSHDCKTLWFPCISVRLAMIFECRMTTWLGFKWGFSKWPVDFHTWHFCSTWDKFIRTLAMDPMSKTSNIRAEYGVFRYLNFFPMSFFISLLL